jgi:RNAse (barnase) inhibitor barstar
MAEIVLQGQSMSTPEDFYAQFFEKVQGLMPDYGGRNLDALHDDLRELQQPLTIIWRNSDEARLRLGDWFDKSVETLSEGGGHPVFVRLE